MYGIHTISQDKKIAVVYVKNPPDIPGFAYRTFSVLSDNGIDVDIILQIAFSNRLSDVIFTVREDESDKTRRILEHQFTFSPATKIEVDTDVSKISVTGEGMQGKPGVAAKVFKCLWDAGVKIINISTSEIKISMIVPASDSKKAMRALNESFDVE